MFLGVSCCIIFFREVFLFFINGMLLILILLNYNIKDFFLVEVVFCLIFNIFVIVFFLKLSCFIVV